MLYQLNYYFLAVNSEPARLTQEPKIALTKAHLLTVLNAPLKKSFLRLFNSSIFGSGTVTTQKTVEKEQFTYFFDFEQEELA